MKMRKTAVLFSFSACQETNYRVTLTFTHIKIKMEVRRRHGGSRQSSVRSTFHEEHEDPDDDIKYHSLPESSSSASSSSDSGWISAYLAWLYEMLPSWSSFAALLRFLSFFILFIFFFSWNFFLFLFSSYGSSGSESLEISPEKQDRIDAFKRHIGIAWSEGLSHQRFFFPPQKTDFSQRILNISICSVNIGTFVFLEVRFCGRTRDGLMLDFKVSSTDES